MWQNNYQWHFDYVRLAKDVEFTFENSKTPIDKNRISLINVEKIVSEKDVGLIDQLLPSIVQYSIENSEHAGILDQNFWKLFRMSQLAVEYLLFCKKYLDQTVTLSKEEIKKLKLENKELRIFNDELKQHTDSLLEKLKTRDLGVFKCTQCSKTFSTREFLNGHIERRHQGEKNIPPNLDIEMEIKEIKQKLNSTEKLIKREELNPKLEDTLNRNYSKVSELLQKFESLKDQLENEFRLLQTQKDFEEKYSKIFQNAIETVKNQHNHIESHSLSPYKTSEKRNSITQTEIFNEKADKFVQAEEIVSNSLQIEKIHVNQIKEACENIANKMGSSLKNIEGQMSTFWLKLEELESKKNIQHKTEVEIYDYENEQKIELLNEEKSSVKQENSNVDRSIKAKSSENKNEYLSRQSSINTRYDDLDRIDVVPETMQTQKSTDGDIETNIAESDGIESEIDTESNCGSETDIQQKKSDIEFVEKINVSKRKSLSTLGKRSITSLRKASVTPEVRNKLKTEIENLICDRLAELGLSTNWKGIPEQTFLKTMDILNHKNELIQKTCPNYADIRKNIIKIVDDNANKKAVNEKFRNNDRRSAKKTRSVLTLNSRNAKSRIPELGSEVEIKNRKIFETDSSSDEDVTSVKRLPSKDFKIVQKTSPYNAVIEDLKRSFKSSENLCSKDSKERELVEYVLEKDPEITKTKSVLKNVIQHVAPAPRKRVLFNLKNDKPSLHDIQQRDLGGSTTSVASSVLDFSEDSDEKMETQEMEGGVENVSDNLSSVITISNL